MVAYSTNHRQANQNLTVLYGHCVTIIFPPSIFSSLENAIKKNSVNEAEGLHNKILLWKPPLWPKSIKKCDVSRR